MKKLTFKEESEAMFEVFIKALQDKFPDNQMHFSIVVGMEKEMDESGNFEVASQSNGNDYKIALSLYKFLKASPEINKDLIALNVFGS